ncbi:MlaD family protein [Mycolicibacterium peregrinum]|uniref:MlaD family protein n=1 Tax=Mycolicibacterium TaxID=1866885 RepID=UPI003AACA7C7
MKAVRNPLLWGATALVLAVVAALVAAMVYVNPPGYRSMTFYTDDASSISPGMTVRIAGMTVGDVRDLSMETDQVRVRVNLQGNAFVGDQSIIHIRMLTIVGGYYVNIESLGRIPQGDKPIPKERVSLPYSLISAITRATEVTDRIDTPPVREALDQVQQGLTGPNIDVISSVTEAGTKLIETLDRQRGQITAALNLSDEYLSELSAYRGQFQEMVEKIAILEQTLVLHGKGFGAALAGLGAIVQRLGPVGTFYMNHREEALAKIIHWQQIVRAWADRTGLVVRILRRTRDRMMTTLDRQNAPPELLATDVCIPLPGSSC